VSTPQTAPVPTRSWLVTVATIPAVALGLIATAVLTVVLSWIGLVIGLVATVALGAWAASRAAADPTQRVLAGLGAHPADPDTHARLVNLVEGLSVSGGIATPSLHVVDDTGANLMVLGVDDRHAHLVVTTGLLDHLERIELEGVLARAVTQIRRGDLAASTTAVEVLTAGGAGSALLARPVVGVLAGRLERAVSPDDDVLLDRDAVVLTRYPPGLCAALRKLDTVSTQVHRPVGATAGLWLADPSGAASDSSRPTLADRADALELL
jgi:heat shock protein HtpX